MVMVSETLRLNPPLGPGSPGRQQAWAGGLGLSVSVHRLAQLIHLSLLLPSPGKKKAAALFDSQAPICPICQVLLRPSELQEHMEQELEQLAQLPAR